MNHSRMRDPETVRSQYNTSHNLDIRRALHAKYSTNKQGTACWLLENIEFFNGCNILELGCGTGVIWEGRLNIIGRDSRLVLSDISDGMLETVSQRFDGYDNLKFQRIDIQQIPYDEGCFDIVIANSMLYHVPDLDKGLAEVRRVMKPEGIFYATTTGESGLPKYIDDTMKEYGFDPGISGSISFSLSNGMAQLSKYFKNVTRLDYEDSLEITDSGDLVDYILSMASISHISQDIYREPLIEFYNGKKNTQGVIHIDKEYGLFIARNRK